MLPSPQTDPPGYALTGAVLGLEEECSQYAGARGSSHTSASEQQVVPTTLPGLAPAGGVQV